MAKGYRLVIYPQNYTLLFDSIEDLDSYTIKYSTQEELIEDLAKSLNISPKEINNIVIEYSSQKKVKNLPIKYKKDNYRPDDVIAEYYEYIMNNQSRILKLNIRHMSSPTIKSFIKDRTLIEDYVLKTLVRNFLSNYRSIRDAYFELKLLKSLSQHKNNISPVSKSPIIDYYNKQIPLQFDTTIQSIIGTELQSDDIDLAERQAQIEDELAMLYSDSFPNTTKIKTRKR